MRRQTIPTRRDYLALDDSALVHQCRVDVYRASGPGGQKRNKTCSAVRLRHQPTGLLVIAEEDRSQHVNKRRAIRRLREAIALRLRGGLDPKRYERSDVLARSITREGRFRIALKNPSYYAVMGEVLDVIAACGSRVAQAAACLEVSTAELVKFIQRDPKLIKRVNELRTDDGLKPLR